MLCHVHLISVLLLIAFNHVNCLLCAGSFRPFKSEATEESSEDLEGTQQEKSTTSPTTTTTNIAAALPAECRGEFNANMGKVFNLFQDREKLQVCGDVWIMCGCAVL